MKNLIKEYWLLFLIFGLGLMSGLNYFGAELKQTVYQDDGYYTILSIDNIYLTHSNKLGKDVARVTFSTRDTGEKARGFVDEEKMKKFTGNKMDYTFQMDVVSKKQEAKYPINVRDFEDNPYTYFIVDIGFQFNRRKGCEKYAKEHNYEFIQYLIKDLPDIRTYCLLAKHKSGRFGDIQSSHTVMSVDITIRGGDYKETKTITSNETTSVQFKDIANIKWVGSLSSMQEPPAIPANYMAWFQPGEGWRLVDKFAYSDVREYDPDDAREYMRDKHIYSDGVEWMEKAEMGIAKALKEKKLENVFWVDKTDMDNGYVKAKLTKDIYFPVFIADLDVDWLHIYQPVGVPEIKCYDAELVAGEKGKIQYEVKNVGDSHGTFEVRLISEAAEIVGYPPTHPLDPGETEKSYIEVMTKPKEFEGSYRLIAVDINNRTNSDACEGSLKVSMFQVCERYGEEYCEDNWRVYCSKDGTELIKLEYCEGGCEEYNGKTRCKEPVACESDEDCPEIEIDHGKKIGKCINNKCVYKIVCDKGYTEIGGKCVKGGACEKQYEACLNECPELFGRTDPFCQSKCWLSYQFCRLMGLLKGVLMGIGIFVIALLVLIIIFPGLGRIIFGLFSGLASGARSLAKRMRK